VRTVKPNCLSVLPRPVEHRGQVHLCVSVFAMVPLRGTPLLFSDQNLWKTLPVAAPDFTEAGVLKTRSEFLVYGSAYPPATDGEPAQAVTFGVRFADLSKTGRAHGLRMAHGSDVVANEALVSAPLNGSASYGGPQYASNPRGTGHPSSRQPDGMLRLPAIEPIDQPWHPDPERNRALTFGALDITHPDRARLAGTYDEAWLKSDYPGLARDGQWAIFNVAPADQQREAPFAADEAYHLANLHPESPHVQGRLPGIIAAAFVQRNGETELERLEMNLRTVVFLPEHDRAVLIWQGFCPCEAEDASDIATILVAAEHGERPRDLEHYAAVMHARLESEDALLASLQDEVLLPEGMAFEGLLPADFDLNKPPPPDSYEARLRRRGERQMQAARDDVASRGLDPDKHAPPATFAPAEPFPPLPQLGEFLRRIEREAQERIDKAKAEAAQRTETLAREFSDAGRDFEVIRREISGANSLGPPAALAPQHLNTLRSLDQAAQAQGKPVQEVVKMLEDQALQGQWAQNDSALRAGYVANAHFQAPVSPAAGHAAESQRRQIAERRAQGAGLQGLDLTGADLRGVDLRGLNCDGVLLEAANLAGVAMAGASFRGALLAHADLSDAQAAGCDFTQANLGKANLERLYAAHAVFTDSNLWQAEARGAVLSGARFEEAQLHGATFTGADLAHAWLKDALFLESDLGGANLSGAQLDGAQFVNAKLERTTWTGCTGKAAVFMNVACPESDFSEAQLPGSRWVGTLNLARARFDRADLSDAYFAQGTVFDGASFEQVRGDRLDLTACRLAKTRWRAARLREASFRRATLTHADLSGADLFGASLANALLHGAQLIGCNLFGADLARMRADSSTRLDRANTAKARVYPRAPAQQASEP
jgi:uncharacterized protein YjbI with pentapeptide repeats